MDGGRGALWRVCEAEWSPCHCCYQFVLTCSHFPRPRGTQHRAQYVRSGILFASCNNPQSACPLQMRKLRQARFLSSASLTSPHSHLPSPIQTLCPFSLQLSRKLGQKKQRSLVAEQPQSPPDGGHTPFPKEPRLEPPKTPVPQHSIYFSSPKGHPARLGSDFFDQPAVPLARAFLGQVI